MFSLINNIQVDGGVLVLLESVVEATKEVSAGSPILMLLFGLMATLLVIRGATKTA